jgi:hypothetical protein
MKYLPLKGPSTPRPPSPTQGEKGESSPFSPTCWDARLRRFALSWGEGDRRSHRVRGGSIKYLPLSAPPRIQGGEQSNVSNNV